MTLNTTTITVPIMVILLVRFVFSIEFKIYSMTHMAPVISPRTSKWMPISPRREDAARPWLPAPPLNSVLLVVLVGEVGNEGSSVVSVDSVFEANVGSSVADSGVGSDRMAVIASKEDCAAALFEA